MAINEMDIGFDAAKAAIQGVEQGTFVLVIIMGMGVNQRHGFNPSSYRACREKRQAGKPSGG